MVALIADKFHVLPAVVAHDLDSDPEQLSLSCLSFLSYANAKSIFDEAMKAGDHKTLDAYQDSDLMSRVRRNTLDTHKAKVEHRKAHPDRYRTGCRLCLSAHRDDKDHKKVRVAGCELCEGDVNGH